MPDYFHKEPNGTKIGTVVAGNGDFSATDSTAMAGDQKYSVSHAEVCRFRAFDGSMQQELVVTLTLDAPVNEPVFRHRGGFFLTAQGCAAKLHIRFYHGELRYFYDHYQDYYYLPEEDVAMHKSVAAYVDRAYRRQATPSTAYLRKSGLFLPQPQVLFSPAYRKEYRDRIRFIEPPEDIPMQQEMIHPYVASVLSFLASY